MRPNCAAFFAPVNHHDIVTAPFNQDFRCTECGQCCRNFLLPLRLAEAQRWLADGHPVEVLCEAIPWPTDAPESDASAHHQHQRSFAALSGQLPVRILITLAAPLGAGCPHLDSQQRCQIYDRRPLACRIYPAEANPFQVLYPASRRCPPEAWQPGGAPLVREGRWADVELRGNIQQQTDLQVDDARRHEALCEALGIRDAALANEGYVAHRPEPQRLREALHAAQAGSGIGAHGLLQNWTLLSERTDSVAMLQSIQARCGAAPPAGASALGRFSFLSRLSS